MQIYQGSLTLQRPMTVGTSTIEVGIDFKDETEKDVLIFEARIASQFLQRFGRLARHMEYCLQSKPVLRG